MTHFSSFAAIAGPWQNFYLLVGTAAATLIGLMFVAVTFGAGLVTRENASTARAFLDPTVTHFMQILITACLVLIPATGALVVGALLVVIAALRLLALVGVARRMLGAQQVHHDVELSDWLMGVVLPLLCHLVLGAAGAGFVAGYEVAFTALAVVTIAMLLNGVYGAWELMLWMALARSK